MLIQTDFVRTKTKNQIPLEFCGQAQENPQLWGSKVLGHRCHLRQDHHPSNVPRGTESREGGPRVPRGTAYSHLAEFPSGRTYAQRSERDVADPRNIAERSNHPDRKLLQVNRTQDAEAEAEVAVIIETNDQVVQL